MKRLTGLSLVAAAILLLLVVGRDVNSRSQDHVTNEPESFNRAAPTRQDRGTREGKDLRDQPFVRLSVGDDFQSIVNHHPPGTRFLVSSGIHRMHSVEPKDDMTFTGEKGAVMSGARVLNDFKKEGSLWLIDGQRQEGLVHPCDHPDGCLLSGYERDNRPEDLFFDSVRFTHASSKSLVGPGSWFFDYERDRIYLGEDPAGHRVEGSVTSHAFYGDAARVVIENIAIRHYANPTQSGAVHARHGLDWKIHHVVASYNHAVGIHAGPGSTISHNRIAYNGQLGIRGWGLLLDPESFGAPIVIQHNEIAHNRALGYRYGWEGGGMKILNTQSASVTNNWVHHNGGPGIWFDSNNHEATIRSNLVEGNEASGIFYEVSYGPTNIMWNTVRGNGAGLPGAGGAGIRIVNSTAVEIYQNAVDSNERGIMLTMVERETGPDGRLELADVFVHDNDVRMLTGSSGLVDETGNDEYYTSKGNAFTDNTYRFEDVDEGWFAWDGQWSGHTWEQWQTFGNDQTGRVMSPTASPEVPDGGKAFAIHRYGPAWRTPE